MKSPLLLAGFLLAAGLTPARAQFTESAQTVQPGGLLFEIDGLRLSFDRDGGQKLRGLGVASTLVSAGLTSTVDFQVGLDLFLRETIDAAGARTSRSGLGDVTLRTKWAFWRDEQLGSAAVIPHVRLPTGSREVGVKAAEFGVILPWERQLPAGIMLGAMFHWDIVRNPDDNGYDSAWNVTGCVQRSLTKSIAVYAEGAVQASSAGGSSWRAHAGAGVLWTLVRQVQLDYEILRGLNRYAVDWTHVLRVNWSL